MILICPIRLPFTRRVATDDRANVRAFSQLKRIPAPVQRLRADKPAFTVVEHPR